MNYLYAAYGAAWIIHGAYLGLMWKRYREVKRERDSLEGRT